MAIGTEIGDEAPAFDLPASGGRRAKLAELRGRFVVVYFYPKADTPGCTSEAAGFEASLAEFAAAGAEVIGISKDSVRKLDAFAAKHGLRFPLASDESGAVVETYGAWVEKSMYGRKYMGIDRATFLVGPDGSVRAAWRRVKVPGHVKQVLQTVGGNVAPASPATK